MYASYFLQETKEDSFVLYIYYYFSYTYIFSNTQTLLMDITLFMNVSSISSLEVSALGTLYWGQVTFTYQFSW